jgi:hypothetical protein
MGLAPFTLLARLLPGVVHPSPAQVLRRLELQAVPRLEPGNKVRGQSTSIKIAIKITIVKNP